jgi:hypothetical protein
MAINNARAMVLVSAPMFKLMSENQRKHEARNEESQSQELAPATKSAETMGGEGDDLPPPPTSYIHLDTAAPPSSVPIASMLPGGESGASTSGAAASHLTKASAGPPPPATAGQHWDKKKMVPLWPNKPWYYIASHPSDSESD